MPQQRLDRGCVEINAGPALACEDGRRGYLEVLWVRREACDWVCEGEGGICVVGLHLVVFQLSTSTRL